MKNNIELKEKLLGLGMFNDNKFLDLYCSLINDNLNNKRVKCETQRHHIIPKVVYRTLHLRIDNSKNNLVNLKFIDHIKAHWYLYKCVMEDSLVYNGLLKAILFMLGKSKECIIESNLESLINNDDIMALYIKEKQLLSEKKQNEKFTVSANYIKYVHSIDGKTFKEVIETVSRDEFYNYYFVENHTYIETKNYFNISSSWIDKLIQLYNIPPKKYRTRFKDYLNLYSKNFIHNLYIIEGKTVKDISLMLNISEEWVRHLLKFYNIRKINSGKKPENLNTMLVRITKEELYKYYVTENHTEYETKKHFNTGDQFTKILHFYNINKLEDTKIILNYDEVYNYYIIQNHTHDDSLKHFKVGRLKFDKFLKDNNLSKKNFKNS